MPNKRYMKKKPPPHLVKINKIKMQQSFVNLDFSRRIIFHKFQGWFTNFIIKCNLSTLSCL